MWVVKNMFVFWTYYKLGLARNIVEWIKIVEYVAYFKILVVAWMYFYKEDAKII